jgi:hypothetical protein
MWLRLMLMGGRYGYSCHVLGCYAHDARDVVPKLGIDSADGYSACPKCDDYSNREVMRCSSVSADVAKEMLVKQCTDENDSEVLNQTESDKRQRPQWRESEIADTKSNPACSKNVVAPFNQLVGQVNVVVNVSR